MKYLMLVLILAGTLLGCTAQPTQPPAPLNADQEVLSGLIAHTNYNDVMPLIIEDKTMDFGASYAYCPALITLNVDRSWTEEYEWTLAHEWGHILACKLSGNIFYPLPLDWPKSITPEWWYWDDVLGANWDYESFADCVAVALTGYDGAIFRDYPSCEDFQMTYIHNLLGV